jgi:RNA-directed DNA polymerase
MNGGGESYSGVVPAKQPKEGLGRPKEGLGRPKEVVEERPLTKENMGQSDSCQTQSRESETSGLDRVRQAAKEDKELPFTALLHHVTADLLGSSYASLKKPAAAGVDGVTWKEYGEGLEGRSIDLHGRIHRGALALNEDGVVSLSSDKVCRASSLMVSSTVAESLHPEKRWATTT